MNGKDIGKLEGRIDEGFQNIKDDISVLYTKIDKLPCGVQAIKITKLETRMKDMIKTRYIGLTAIVGLLVYLIQYITVK